MSICQIQQPDFFKKELCYAYFTALEIMNSVHNITSYDVNDNNVAPRLDEKPMPVLQQLSSNDFHYPGLHYILPLVSKRVIRESIYAPVWYQMQCPLAMQQANRDHAPYHRIYMSPSHNSLHYASRFLLPRLPPPPCPSRPLPLLPLLPSPDMSKKSMKGSFRLAPAPEPKFAVDLLWRL